MLSFPKWLEAHHSYDNPDWDTKFQPLKKDDTFRVFHGFNNFRDAYRAAVYGLTGREYADRRYSYEADNNPYGLFVTLHLKKAGDFTSGDPVNQAVTAAAQCMYGIGHAKAAGREVCSARPLAVPVRSNGLMCDGQFSRGCSPS